MDWAVENNPYASVRQDEKYVPVHPIHGEGMKIRLYVVDASNIGGQDRKSKVVGRFVDKDGQESGADIPMIIKEAKVNNYFFGSESTDMSPAERYFERWKYLESIGVPVVPNVVVVDANRVAMTDMTVEGAEFFGKAKRLKMMDKKNSRPRPLSEAEKVFIKTNVDAIKTEIKRVHDLMAEHGIRMSPDDACDIWVHPDGTFKVVILDLESLGKGSYDSSNYRTSDPLESTLFGVDRLQQVLLDIKK